MPVIAIDGPAASGKGTIGFKIAEALGFGYLDTGALYRAVAKRVVDQDQDPAIPEYAVAAALWLQQHIKPELLADPALRSDDIGVAAAKVAAIPDVRIALLDLQRDFAKNPGSGFKGAVLDGRDIGTVICPEADIKLFITADVEIRAERRLKELQSRGINATYDPVLKDMRERDARDQNRSVAPLKPASDAVIIDNGHLSREEALEKALSVVREKLGRA
jgi:cytidylate kinase